MATYTIDKIGYGDNVYVLQDSGALQLTGGNVTGPVNFGDSVAMDEATVGDLIVNGAASFTNNIQVNTINGVNVEFATLMNYKGAKAATSNLPTTGNSQGDVWHINADGSEWGWNGSAWEELGKAIDLSGYVPTSRTINGKALTSNISLTASDVSALPSNTTYVSTITTATGAHTAITSKSGAVSFNVPTTAAHVGAATSDHVHGNITNGGDITATAPTIANGDQIIINDNSASKITNGPTFDGSTTTKALTPKGTWETFSQFSGSYNDLTNKPTIPTDTNYYHTTGSWNGLTYTATKVGSPGNLAFTIPTGTSSTTVALGNHTHSGYAASDHTHSNYVPWLGNLTTLGSGTPAEATRNYWTNSISNNSINAAYNTSGTEYSILFSRGGSASYGSILKWGYNDLYLYLLRMGGGSWKNNEWEKISAGYADSAGSIAWGNVSGKPTATGSATTGISISSHSTTSITGVSGSTTASKVTVGTAGSVTGVSGSTSVRGVKTGTSSTTTASHVKSGGNGTAPSWSFTDVSCDDITAWSAGSFTRGTFSGGSGAFSTSVSNHIMSFSHTHTAATHAADSFTAPSLSYTAKTASKASGSNGSASNWVFEDITVPIRADADTTVPTAASSSVSIPSVSASDVTVPKAATSATTVVTSGSHSITDNGHTHSIS